MNDYIHALERELVAGVRGQELTRSPRRRAATGRLRLVLAPVAAAAVAGALFAAVGARSPVRTAAAYALPALRTPTVDARRHSGKLQELTKAGADLARAHEISTPFGTGYVTAGSDGQTVCVAIPDTSDGYGQSCTSAAEIEAHGFVVSMVSPTPASGPSEVVVLLPAAAREPVLRFDNGTERRLRIQQGAASATIAHNATLILTVRGARYEQSIAAVEPQSDIAFQCSDGYVIVAHTLKEIGGNAVRERECAAHGGLRGAP